MKMGDFFEKFDGFFSVYDSVELRAESVYDYSVTYDITEEIFDYARNLAGNPHKCIMIGDNPVDDIKGAKEAGFETILVNDRHPDYSGEYADHICKTLTAMLDVLK